MKLGRQPAGGQDEAGNIGGNRPVGFATAGFEAEEEENYKCWGRKPPEEVMSNE